MEGKTMAEYRALVALCFCAAALIGIAQLVPVEFIPPVDSANIPETVPLRGTFPLVHFTFNWFLSWRFDPLIETLSQSLMGSRHVGPFLLGVVFMAGVGLAGMLLRPKTTGRAVLLSVFGTIVLFQYFGSDTVLWGSLAWVPLLASVGHIIRQRPSIAALILFLLIGAETLLSANGAAPLAVGIAWALAMGISRYAAPESPPSRVETSLFSALLVGAIIVGATTMIPQIPSYPSYARVVADDYIPGNALPLIGPSLQIPTVDREELKPVSSILGLLLLGALLLTSRRSSGLSEWRDPLAILGFGSALLLVLDGHFFSDPWAQIFPLQSLTRMIPGLFITPIHFVIFAGGFTATLFRMTYHPRFLADISIVLLLLGTPLATSFSIKGVYGWVTDRGSEATLSSALREKKKLSRVLSPSYRLLRLFPELQQRSSMLHLYPAPKLAQSATLSASSHNTDLEVLRDGSLETRWTTGTGSQSGQEWLALHWDSPKEISGIELKPGPYANDFPRGVRVSVARSCETGTPVAVETLVDLPTWQGSLSLTREKAPYLDGQEKVLIRFPEKKALSCLFIQQTGTTASRDWSVAELLLFK